MKASRSKTLCELWVMYRCHIPSTISCVEELLLSGIGADVDEAVLEAAGAAAGAGEAACRLGAIARPGTNKSGIKRWTKVRKISG